MNDKLFKYHQQCKKIRDIYRHPSYIEVKKVLNKEIDILLSIKTLNIFTLFTTIANYYIMIGIKRSLITIERLARKADELDLKTKGHN